MNETTSATEQKKRNSKDAGLTKKHSNRTGNRNNLRYPIGSDHHCAKLTVAQVREARWLKEKVGLCQGCIAVLVNAHVHPQTLWAALNYVTWRHVK